MRSRSVSKLLALQIGRQRARCRRWHSAGRTPARRNSCRRDRSRRRAARAGRAARCAMWLSLPFSALNCDGGMPRPNSADGFSHSQRMCRFSNSGASSRSKMRRCSSLVAGGEQLAGIAAVRAGQQMAGADEGAEQAVAVEVRAEIADAAAAEPVARLPVARVVSSRCGWMQVVVGRRRSRARRPRRRSGGRRRSRAGGGRRQASAC